MMSENVTARAIATLRHCGIGSGHSKHGRFLTGQIVSRKVHAETGRTSPSAHSIADP